ncbi:MAG: response regulator [Victivallales bacterium]|nr:response regulator [Victivallales bacterium]MCF7888841.1 response regulator [Victivallales bacterium]
MSEQEKRYFGKTALVVDDDFDYQELISFYLKSYGFEVVVGGSQAEGEKLIQETDFDLAVFDLMMENSDSGFVLSYKLKKTNPKIPVIIVTNVTNETGYHFDVSTDEMRSWIKADVILDKDIRNEQLYNEINKLLG